MNMVGYTIVLPDMIGGNGYGGSGLDGESSPPDKEIFLRWLQANTFMPALQFSYTPWDYDADVCVAFFHASQFPLCAQYQRLISLPLLPLGDSNFS